MKDVEFWQADLLARHARVTSGPKVPPDTVVEQLEEGFCFGDSDEVLRPATAPLLCCTNKRDRLTVELLCTSCFFSCHASSDEAKLWVVALASR